MTGKKLALISIFSLFNLMFAPVVRAQELTISDNGAGSSNVVTIQVENQSTSTQVNEANVGNTVEASANTGDNSVSSNSGGTASIVTGDVQTTVVVENAVNTSVANATSCCSDVLSVTISENGSGSENTVQINEANTNTTVVSNLATVTNTLMGVANTGNNSVDSNFGGSISIETGDIKVGGNITNGPVNSSVVNVGAPQGSGLNARIFGNATDSNSTISVKIANSTNVITGSTAEIANFVIWDLNTGGNAANSNTDGNVFITTGDIDFDFIIRNFVNLGEVEVTCCQTNDPGTLPSPTPTPSDTSDRGTGGSGGENTGGSSLSGSSGSILAEAASTENIGGTGIFGLSDTSGDHQSLTLWFWVGLLIAVFGGKILSGELSVLTFKPWLKKINKVESFGHLELSLVFSY